MKKFILLPICFFCLLTSIFAKSIGAWSLSGDIKFNNMSTEMQVSTKSGRQYNLIDWTGLGDSNEWDALFNGPKEVKVAPTQEMKQDDGTTHYTTQPETYGDLKKLQEESPNGYYDEATNTFHYNDKLTEGRRKLADEDKEKGTWDF